MSIAAQNRSPFDLSGKVAMVTGASRGIGRGIALGLARAGADVVLAARSEAHLREVAREVEDLGRRAAVLVVDVRDLDGLEQFVEASAAAFGRLDILVNNAGGSGYYVEGGGGGFLSTGRVGIEGLVEFNFTSPYLLAQSAARLMIEQGESGVIINITSATAVYSNRKVQVYGAIKLALQELTTLWAEELGPHGIRVHAIAPGSVASAQQSNRTDPIERVKTIPLGRIGDPADVAAAVVFLASDEARWISGTKIVVNGGERVVH